MEGETKPEIEITPKMIEAGVMELCERRFGDDLSVIAEAVYLLMELERRA